MFQGDEENPGSYDENEKIPENMDGIGWYGWTKNRAEKILKNSDTNYAIVRIAYPFYSNKFGEKLDFAKNYLKLFDEDKLFPPFS